MSDKRVYCVWTKCSWNKHKHMTLWWLLSLYCRRIDFMFIFLLYIYLPICIHIYISVKHGLLLKVLHFAERNHCWAFIVLARPMTMTFYPHTWPFLTFFRPQLSPAFLTCSQKLASNGKESKTETVGIEEKTGDKKKERIQDNKKQCRGGDGC